MEIAFACGLTAPIFLLLGLYQLLTPADQLWARQERYLLRQGLAPQRTQVWENSIKQGGYAFLGIAAVFLLIAIIAGASDPRRNPPSPLTINGEGGLQSLWPKSSGDLSPAHFAKIQS